MFKNKILLSDLDGTLLNKNREVSPENLKAITHFVENGGRFGVATGRDIENVLHLLAHVPINFYCIFSNGSVLFDKEEKKVLAERTMVKETILPFLQRCRAEHPEIGIQIHSDQGTVFFPDESVVEEEIAKSHRPYTCKSFEELSPLAIRKLLFITPDGDMTWLKEQSEPFTSLIQRVQTSPRYFEFLPQGSSKGGMIREIRPLVSSDDVIFGVGDFHNDKEMMSESDVGILCANAPEELKPLAKHICADHNNHPLHDVIYNIMSKYE